MANASWRSSAKNALSMLIGWQTLPALIIVLYLLVGIFGPTLAPFDPNRGTISHRLCPPLAIDALTIAQHPASRSTECSAANVLGTDHNGRDIFSRLLHGARTSLSVVGPSVVLGTTLGTLVCAVINGWRTKARLIAYLITSVTIVPLGIFLSSGLRAMGILYVIFWSGEGVDWVALTVLSSASSVITLAIVVIAYRYDETCRSGWLASADVDTDFPNYSCGRKLHRQIVALAPWIVFASITSAALVFLGYVTISATLTEIGWSFVNYHPFYPFEHIGMYGLFVPLVLIPIAFVSLATWWVVHGLLSRFKSTSMLVPSTDRDLEAVSDEQLSVCSMSTDEDSDHAGMQTIEDEAALASTDPAQNMNRRRWLLTIVAIGMAAVVIRFGYADALPIIRELGQDWTSDHYQSALARSLQERDEAMNCAYDLRSRIDASRSSSEQLEIDAGQSCLDLYFQQRNAPTHRWTINYAMRFLSRTLTLALIGCIVSAALWAVASTSTNATRGVIGACVVLVAMTGLTMTFAHPGWILATGWLDPMAARFLSVVRDFSVGLGVCYLTIAIAKPTIRFEKVMPKLDVLYNWASFFVPCTLLTSGLLILFHYRFPSYLLFDDDSLSVIVDPSPEQIYYLAGFPIRYWLWTYWFALIGYAGIVFGFFAAAIWGFRRFVRSAVNGVDSTPVNLENPSRAQIRSRERGYCRLRGYDGGARE